MTREEAIKLIEHISIAFVPTDQYGDYDDPQPYEEALDMAIEALSAEGGDAEMTVIPEGTGVMKPCPDNGADLISRAEAIDAIQDAYCKPCKEQGDDYNGVRCRACDFDCAITQIDALPSAEAVQGEWIKTVDGNGWNEWYVLKCPFCGATIEDKQYHSWGYNFCPNCGARMTPYKGGDDE